MSGKKHIRPSNVTKYWVKSTIATKLQTGENLPHKICDETYFVISAQKSRRHYETLTIFTNF